MIIINFNLIKIFQKELTKNGLFAESLSRNLFNTYTLISNYKSRTFRLAITRSGRARNGCKTRARRSSCRDLSTTDCVNIFSRVAQLREIAFFFTSVHCTLKSTTRIFVNFKHRKIYLQQRFFRKSAY